MCLENLNSYVTITNIVDVLNEIYIKMNIFKPIVSYRCLWKGARGIYYIFFFSCFKKQPQIREGKILLEKLLKLLITLPQIRKESYKDTPSLTL